MRLIANTKSLINDVVSGPIVIKCRAILNFANRDMREKGVICVGSDKNV